jgi:acetylornithine deacetylase/succinyl-diaminopimelate desuccinylase-like protein
MSDADVASGLNEALRLVERNASQLLDEAIGVARIPAPPFGEAERSAHVARRFREVGLTDVQADELGNVVGRRKGEGPRIMVVSHMDTVFPAGTPVEPRIEGDRVFGPGIRDNSTAVANLISLPRLLDEARLALPRDLILASSVGEEGLGDLRGMRKLMADWGGKLDAVVAYDGDLGKIVHGGVGSQRFKITYRATGGHSFEAFGNPSAVHGLVTACARFCRIKLPKNPKTTINVGTINGGTSVNAIAEEAVAVIDMRSVGQPELEQLAAEALAIFRDTAGEFECTVELEQVGNRPGGSIPADHPLVQAAVATVKSMGLEPRLGASSTDANIPLSLGIPAVCVGSSLGSRVHTVSESLLISSIVPGLQQLIRLLARLDAKLFAGLPARR